MSKVYSDKQLRLLRLWQQHKLRRINLLEGSVRSGKTWISLVLWAFWVATMPQEGNYLMVAKTLTSLRRNCLDLLQTLVGKDNFTYSISKKEGCLFGRLIYLEGVNDSRAESKIRGMTLQGAYCDELTLFTEDFFSMLLSRLSCPGAKLIATTNPDSPQHWLKVKYIDRCDELDMLCMQFLIDDNPYLDKEYIANLKKEYSGVYYDRFILGLWKTADGLIYRQFADNPEHWIVDTVDKKQIDFISIGIDFGGNRSLTAFVATAVLRNYSELIVLRDYHIAGTKGEIDADRMVRELIGFIRRLQADYPGIYIRYCFADCAEQYLITTLRKGLLAAGLNIPVGDSDKNAITSRIICTNTLLNTNRLHLLRGCDLLRRGLEGAAWDSKAAEKGEDKRLDDFTSDIDILDAFEYSFERFMRKLVKTT